MSSPTAAPTQEPELNQLNNIRYFGLILGGLVGFAILYCGAWVYRNRQLRVVKVYQPLFLITICFGLFVYCMGVIPLSLDVDVLSERGMDRCCMAFVWLVTIGYTVSFAALFAKLYRINKLFHNPRFQRVKVEAKDEMKPFLVLFSINFFLLLGWTLVDPMQVDANGFCENDGEGAIFEFCTALVMFVSLILVCRQAWKARDISVEFNESKYLAIGIYNWLQLQVVAVPTQFVLGNDYPSASYLLEVSLLLMECFSMLLVLFVPIFLQVRKFRRSRQGHSTTTTGASPLPLGGHVHVTGVNAISRETAITGTTATTSTEEEGNRTNVSDKTEVTALKNRITTLEEAVNDLDRIKHQNVELVKRNKELEDLLRIDEEKEKKQDLLLETKGNECNSDS